jgi:hypothetical protein
LEEILSASVWKTENTAVGIRFADHATPLYPQMLALTLLTIGGGSVGIVCLRTKATEFVCFVCHDLSFLTYKTGFGVDDWIY